MTVEEILAALQAIIDGAVSEEGEPRPLDEAEMERYEKLEADLLVARKSAEVIKRNAAYRTVNSGGVVLGSKKQNDDTYSRAFEQYLRTGQKNSDLIERAQSKSPDSAGGFLVPDEWRDKIVEKLLNFGGLMNAAEKITTSDGRNLTWVTNDDTAGAAAITAESALWTAGTDLVFAERTLGAFKYTTVGASSLPLKVSFELLQDSMFDLQSFIARKFAQRIARKLAVDLITGVGTTAPQGIISTAGGLASTTARAAAAAPTYAELLRTVHALDPDYRDGASWLMNDATLALIQGIVDTTGRPLLWNSNEDATGSLKGLTLLGYPVVIDQAMPTAAASGAAKAIVFGNLRDTYVVREVKSFELVVLNELYAQNGQVGFMGWARYDGMVQDPNAAIVLPNAT